MIKIKRSNLLGFIAFTVACFVMCEREANAPQQDKNVSIPLAIADMAMGG